MLFSLFGKFRQTKIEDNRVDNIALVTQNIEPLTGGRIRFQGSWWCARCNQDITIEAGKMVYVVGRQNITYIVEPLS